MNNIELELSEWGDGTTRLSFWDSLHGQDRHFVLSEDGQAFDVQSKGADDDEIMIRTSLVHSLLKLLKDVAADRSDDEPL